MSSPTLDYSPTRQPSFRLGHIALASSALALGILISRIVSFLLVFTTRSDRVTIYLYSALISAPAVAAGVAACVLFAFALPPRRYSFLRGTLIACAAFDFIFFALYVGMILLAYDTSSPIGKNLDAILMALGIVGLLQNIANLAAYAAVFILAARDLQRPALGILAACGLIPQFFTSFLFIAYYALRYLPTNSILYISYASIAVQIWTFLFWLAIALFALILASHNRHRT